MIYTAVFCFFISHTDSRIPLSVLSANQEFQDHLPWLLLEVHSFSPFSPWFLFAKVHEIQAYHHTHIYIYIVHIPKIAPRYTSPELWILKSLSSEALPDLSLFVRASTAEMTPNGSHDQTRFYPSTTVRHVSTRPLSVCGFLLLFGGRSTGWKSYSLKGSCIVHP